jgi:hypothetical protein
MVTSVSGVDLLDGVYTVDNRPVAVRVAGIRSVSSCWASEALASASELLRGKQVRLTGDRSPADPDGRVRARVLLPDRHDYALTILGAGAARLGAEQGGLAYQKDLAAAEADARRARRGSWGSFCETSPGSHSAQQPPNGQDPTAAGQELTPARTPAQLPDPTMPVPPTIVTTTTAVPPVPDAVQRGVQAGEPCSPEGARGVTGDGTDVVCAATAGGVATWRKA